MALEEVFLGIQFFIVFLNYESEIKSGFHWMLSFTMLMSTSRQLVKERA